MSRRIIFVFLIMLSVITLAISTTVVQSQPLFEENFNYANGEKLTDHGWTAHSSSGTNPITVTTPGLTYTDYSSVSGNAALLDNSGEDVNHGFTAQNSGTIYVSFLVNVSSVSTSGGYFLHLGPSTIGYSYFGRVWVKQESSDIEFGLSKKTGTPAYTDNNYSKNTTYLLVLKYEFKTGTSNDEVSLFVFADPDLPGSEPGTPTLGPRDSDSDPSNLGSIALRQFSSSQNITVDGIRIATSWSDAPIPVELTSFTAKAVDNQVKLAWTTQSETENLGFHVHRSLFENASYIRITSEIIAGSGNSSQSHTYSYTDQNIEPGKIYYYKLADLDFNGNINFHGPISVAVDHSQPREYSLAQNTPNPFNPQTQIQFALKESGRVTLKIYNLSGQLVRTLLDAEKSTGSYSVIWDGTDEHGIKVTSGTYLYRLQVNGFRQTKKLVFIN